MTTTANPGISPVAMDDRTFHPTAEKAAAVTTEDRLRLLIDTGLLLSSGRSVDVILQAALDAGLALCGAAYGAFFYNNLGPDGEPYQLYKVSGIDHAAFEASALPRPGASYTPNPYGTSILRSDDITRDSRFTRNGPISVLSMDHSGVRSYLAVPVRSRGGEVFGALLYGHPDAGVFAPEHESLVATVAAQAAVAIENSRLTEVLKSEVALADIARSEQREAERRLRHALDATQLGTWSWDPSTGLIDLDERAAELFAVEPHQPISRNRLRERMVVREDLDQTPLDLREVLASGGQYAAEYRIRLKDGTERWIAASGIVSLDERSQVVGLIGTVQDISMRKKQENSLRESEKLAATGRLAATIAHEINNPLEAVTNLIYLAKTDPTTPAPVQRMLETADGELARVGQIAQQTLGFYRDTTRPVKIDLNELLHTVVELFNRKLAARQLRCLLDLKPGLSIMGLQGEIRQVISNHLVNAIDASLMGGCIQIRGRHRKRDGNEGVSVLVGDQGTGIPEEVQRRLFTPFVTTKDSRGTGLGLWVTRGMVEKHGGSVRFRSRTQTPSGTLFRVYLPKTPNPQFFDPQTSVVLQ